MQYSYGQFYPLGALWLLGNITGPLAIIGPKHQFWPQAISCLHWPSWPAPRPLSLFLGLGVLSIFKGLMAPWPNHLYYGGLGHLGPLRRLQCTGYLGIFWPNSNEAKGAAHQPPMPAHGLWKPPEATSSAASKISPHIQGKTAPSPRIQEWCIYDIIYNYAPFLLSNPMVTFSGPNYVIPNQVPNTSPISKEEHSAIQSGNSLAATRRPSKDPNHLALQEFSCHFLSGLFKGKFSEFINLFNHCKGIKYSAFLGQLNWSIQVVIKHPVWPWPNWANSYSTVGLQSHSSILKMARTVLAQFRKYSWVNHLPGSAFQLFTYTGHLSSPGEFFPS
ncbi:hypothetical protein O181_069657 [Austropuccinia psidii MF-1]|uniref:Uncharacterized protein n=1 Tax=Austropuccinia psidii MF-1 TaxID=1389203 RepID=A0A9Q3F1Q6_9BASI|nr:hypothetical protein [Austropuccinia psidii MF-1]